MSQTITHRTLSLLLAVPTLLAGAGLRLGASEHPTPAETLREFESQCRSFSEGENIFFGSAIVEEMRQRLERVAGDTATEIRVRARLGYELLRLGRFEAAIEQLERAIELFDATPDAPPGGDRELLKWLGLSHLRFAETLNCVGQHAPESCILPIRPEAVHASPEHSRLAGDLFLRLLERYPQELQGRWLLNLARMVSGDYPRGVPAALRLPPEALRAEVAFEPLRDIGLHLGMHGMDLSGGAVMDDFDGDGLLDLVSSSWSPCQPMKAFRNDGRGGFEEVSEAWGLASQFGGLNLVQADYDNDGDLDLLVLRGAWLGKDGRVRNSLLRNDLDADSRRFVDVTAAAGLAHPAYPTQAAGWADYDADGDLDLFIGNEAEASSVDPLSLYASSGAAYPSQLFRNNGDGSFTDVARLAGVLNMGFAKGVAWGDYDDDGRVDLYVSNIGPNRLYRNLGESRFVDVTEELAVSGGEERTFATWFFDYDNDGDLDLWANRYSAPVEAVTRSYLGQDVPGGEPMLFRNEGGRFVEVSRDVGLTRPLLPMGSNFGDVDGDGWLDVYLGTGVPSFDSLMPNVFYRNIDGSRFADATFSSRLGQLQKGHGVAFGDLDNDGDQDLFTQLGGAFPSDGYLNALFVNPRATQAWIVLRLQGVEANRFAIGGRLRIDFRVGGETRSVYRTVGSGGSFGGSSLQQEIGLGEAEGPATVTVRWPGSGRVERFDDVALRRFYEVVEGTGVLRPLDPQPPVLRLESGGHR